VERAVANTEMQGTEHTCQQLEERYDLREKLTIMVSLDTKMPSWRVYSCRSFEVCVYFSTASEMRPVCSWCSTYTHLNTNIVNQVRILRVDCAQRAQLLRSVL
jgi:hypothetical protein